MVRKMEEWKKWKSVGHPCIRHDTHHAEIVDVRTGEVLKESMSKSSWEEMEDYEVNFCNNHRNYYRSLRIYRMDIGDAFCTTDWSKH